MDSFKASLSFPALIALISAGACSNPLPTSPSSIPFSARSPIVHTVAGRITDPNGVAVAGAVVSSAAGSEEVRTGPDGAYSLRADVAHTTMTVSRDGYEPRTVMFERSTADVVRDVVLQPVVAIGNHSTVALALTPQDLNYYVAEPYDSDYCGPCKMIRLRAAANSRVRVELTWSADNPVALWVQGTRVATAAANGRVVTTVAGRDGDILLHVGRAYVSGQGPAERNVAFQLTTAEEE